MRNSFYDNIKGLLCLLVVCGHLCERVLVAGDIIKYVYMFIYSFHIPLFIFVSGCFSQRQNYKKILSDLIYPYFIWQMIYFGIACWIPESALNSTIKTWLLPIWLLWYLVALIIWKLIIPFFDVHSKWKKILLVIIAVIAGMVVGFDPYGTMILSIQRVIVLFPYFLVGYYVGNGSDYEKKRIPLFFLIPLVPLGLILVRFRHEFNILWLFNSVPYEQIGEPWIVRLYLYFLSSFMMMLVYKIITQKPSFLSMLGRNSMQIYLGHGIIILLLLKLKVYDFMLMKYNAYILLVICFVLSVLICFILGNDFVKRIKYLWSLEKR